MESWTIDIVDRWTKTMKNGSKKGLSQGGKKDHLTQLYNKALSRIEAEFISVLAKDRILELREREEIGLVWIILNWST